MRSWSEFQIGLVYFSGLLAGIILSLLVIIYLSPINKIIKKLVGKLDLILSRSFKTTIILAGFLGAISVSFRDCNGSYEYLLKSRGATLAKGIGQVSSAFDYILIITLIWFIIFLALFMVMKKNEIKDV